jgi:hypothetical protein
MSNEYDAISSVDDYDAISERRKPTVKAPEQDFSPDAGMTGSEKFLVGMGSSADKALRGIKGLVGMDTSQGKEDAERYQKNRPKGWQTTVGEIAGDAMSYAPLAPLAGAGLGAQVALGAGSSMALTPGDIQERAKAGVMGAGGAYAGHHLTRALGRLAQAAGIKPTFGQAMAQKDTTLGRSIGRLEEAAQSTPVAGGPLRRTREGVMDQWRAATREAASPPGMPARSVDEVGDTVSAAYNRVLENTPLPPAARSWSSVDGLAAARAPGRRTLPVSNAQRADAAEFIDEVVMNHTAAAGTAGQARAATAHAIESDLKTAAAGFRASGDPAQRNYGELLERAARDYADTWRRGLAPDVADQISALDRRYPSLLAIKDAARKVGSSVSDGDPNRYTPAVLNRAARTMDRSGGKGNYIRGEAPQQELARIGQTLQGKVPDSGTTERALSVGGLGGAGAVGGAIAGGTIPAAAVGSVAAALALAGYGTKQVQDFMMGRLAPHAQQAMLDALRRAAPFGAAAGAGVAAN